jgi:hypothetical protein
VAVAAQDHQYARQLPHPDDAALKPLSRHQECQFALVPRPRMDDGHGAVCHPIWRGFSGDSTMMRRQTIITARPIIGKMQVVKTASSNHLTKGAVVYRKVELSKATIDRDWRRRGYRVLADDGT